MPRKQWVQVGSKHSKVAKSFSSALSVTDWQCWRPRHLTTSGRWKDLVCPTGLKAPPARIRQFFELSRRDAIPEQGGGA
jgi:hypothetical protein